MTMDSEGRGLPGILHDAVRQARSIEQLDRAIGGEPAVAVLAWPADYSLLEQLKRQGLPRLLLLPPGVQPIVTDDLMEDWVRLPASDIDVRCRLQRLRACAAVQGFCRI